MKCLFCEKDKKDMVAYVPMRKLNGARYVIGRPGFVCTECLKRKEHK